MRDKYNRNIEYLRVSVTRNCNLNCIYCMPQNDSDKEKQLLNLGCKNFLTPSEYNSIISEMAQLGIKKVRITGGEPLIRPDINEIIERVAKIPGIIDLSMTTNGVNLASKANDLKKSGLHRVNISLDTLNPERFMKITGVSGLHNVLEGIDNAINADLKPIKINTVLIKGINDGEIDDFFLLTKDRPIEVRFIELMPIGKFGENNRDKIVYNSGIIDTYKELVKLQNRDESLPARYYKMPGFRGKIGFISPISHKFCGNCNRIRLTCDGKIKLCLGDNDEYDLLKVLREEPIKLNEFIREVISKKPRGHNFSENFNSQRSMNNIGG